MVKLGVRVQQGLGIVVLQSVSGRLVIPSSDWARYLDHSPGGGSFPKDLPGDDLLLVWNPQAITSHFLRILIN